MKDEQQFMINLLDFSNLPSKRTQYDSLNSKGSNVKKINNTNNKLSSFNNNNNDNNNNIENQFILMSTHNQSSQRLLQSFNGLREKLQILNRQNITLKDQLQNKGKQTSEFAQKQSYLKSAINQRNGKVSMLQEQVLQYKRRLQTLKYSSEQIQNQSNELQSYKIKISSLLHENQRLKQQLHRSMQISINQKINLQQKLQYLRLKQIQNDKIVEQAENKLYQKNIDYIRLQNQYKKLKIVYDEEMFSKKFTGQKDIILRQNAQFKIKLEEIQNKYRKEKNKKYQLEGKLLELQEKVRLYGTKTDIYQGELVTINKKMKKVQKNQNQAQKQANAALQERLTWEQKFYNSLIISQELISRVKRQLLGDVVELAKVSQFRLNKLKNDQKVDLYNKKIQPKRNKSSSVKKLRCQTICNTNNKVYDHIIQQKPILINFTQKQSKQNNNINIDCFSKTVLKQANANIFNTNKNNDLVDIKRNLFNVMNTPTTKVQNNKANQIEVQSMNLQSKIRKQRQLMERKLRQKILYNKIQDATNQGTKSRLRDQFFTLAAKNL